MMMALIQMKAQKVQRRMSQKLVMVVFLSGDCRLIRPAIPGQSLTNDAITSFSTSTNGAAETLAAVIDRVLVKLGSRFAVWLVIT
jgi:hypothetical protein